MNYLLCSSNSLECKSACSCILSEKVIQISIYQHIDDDMLRSHLIKVTERIKIQKSEGILINLVGMPHISPAMERWLVLRWQPLALETNLVYCAIVVPAQLLSVPIKRCVMSMSYYFDVTLHSDFQKAQNWLQFKITNQYRSRYHDTEQYFAEQLTRVS